MGRVKQFAIWVADCVYLKDMTNVAIVSAALSNWSAFDQDYGQWISEQIKVVRSNPHIYAPNCHSIKIKEHN